MNTLRQKRAWSCGLTKEATTSATANSNVASSYFFSRVRPKLRPWCRVIPSGPVDQQTTLEKRYFERSSSEKQIRNRTQDISFSFKMHNMCCKKGKLIVNSMKKTYGDTNLKPPIRTTVRSANASELLEKAVLGTTKTMVTSKLPSGDISTQGLSSDNSNTHEYVLESTLLSSPKKGELEDQTDEEPPIKLKKEMYTEEKVLLMGETNSATPSLTEANSNDEIAGHGNKCFPRVICSSRPSAILNRSSDWEKLAMKSRSIFLKQRSQKMLKDRLEKYCVTRRKSHISNSERLDAKRASQTPTAPPLTVPPSAPTKFNQNLFDLCWNNFKKRVEQSKTACASNENKTLAEKSMLPKVNSNHGISEFDLQDAKKIPFSSRTKTLPLTAINRSSRKVMSNRSDVKHLSFIGDTKDAAEKEVKKEVESLVERAQLQTAANSRFRTSQDLRKSVSGNIQEGCAFGMTDDGAKLKKMWALVAEETSLTNSLNDINTKINKVKADLCILSSESFQIKKRLGEVRLLKSQLLNNSHDTAVRQ